MTIQIPKKPRSVKIEIPEPEKSRSGEDASTPQRLVSMAGHPKNRLYINIGASLHIIFNRELFGGLIKLNMAINIQAGGKLIHISQIGSLHEALRHLSLPVSQTGSLQKALQQLPLPVSTYHYSENAIANLLSFAKLADEYNIICNTRVNDAIYVQSKDDGKYLQFQRDHKFNLHYVDINEANVEDRCYFNTVKEGKDYQLDQKRAEVARTLQERCGFLSDKDFIKALIEGVDFGRRDVKVANEIYSYCWKTNRLRVTGSICE